ncbi:hypothetical protein OAJ86_00115 [Nitrosopumilus sp.]|uniref:Uncharacterized protein n=1 Tax=uncultured marine thaumarchaeote KM3_84_A09 TaxID=1456310 RepID=A0A075HY13_9ARCH|nr:hypothetical protein [uncultured marine thaumarchaeote KM3_84_A09]MDC0217410.1 hypothetical protein [Nitrosopumilus sp.]RCL30875.1 MAG: hypothetical protein DBX08_05530 [Nitrosopumilus sp.]
MTDHFVSFLDDIWEKFPTFAEKENTDLTNHNLLWSLDEYRKANYVNFKTGKKELYRLSILLENYAEKHDTPLLATFETEARYKYVEKRYLEILSKISKAWIIGNFINPELAPHPPATAEVISCDGTNISPMWIVLTKGENGPFGLVAEDIGDKEYRGFFTSNSNILDKVIDDINEQLKIKITI